MLQGTRRRSFAIYIHFFASTCLRILAKGSRPRRPLERPLRPNAPPIPRGTTPLAASCNHSKDPNATISWTLVSAEDAPLHALVPTIVSLRRIEAGEFVMLDYGVRYNMDAAHCQ